MGILETATPLHWNYFLTLEDDLIRLSRYLEPTQSNFDAYSLELARILFSAASEVDVVAKQLCKKLDQSSNANNINAYKTELVAAYPFIATSQVSMPRFGLNLRPWDNWNENENPIWWRAYNNVKHKRHTHFSEASLKHAMNAVAGLFVLLLLFYSEQAQSGQLNPDPALLRAGAPFVVGNLAWSPHTFTYQLELPHD